MSEIDWNVELRKIVREYDGLPPEPARPPRPPQKRRSSKTEIRLERIEEIAAKYRFYDRLSFIGVWVRLALVVTLTVSLFWWPYGHSCGFPLIAFLISNVMAIVGGASLAVRTWRDRQERPFVGALLVVVVAWTVIALHVVPRLGYSPAGVATAGWSCTPKR